MDSLTVLEPVGLGQQVMNQVPFWISGLVWAVLALAFLLAIDKLWFRKFDIGPQIKKGNVAVALVVLAFVLGFFFLAGSVQGAPRDRWDDHFQRATRLHWGASVHWTWFKAQGMTESALNPNVCSPVGACGLMQFMEPTARDFGINPFDPRASIYAAVDYMRRLYSIYKAPRPHWDRYAFACASYNWGAGNVIRIAQPRARERYGADNLWAHVEPFLPEETAHYWPRIVRWKVRFSGG